MSRREISQETPPILDYYKGYLKDDTSDPNDVSDVFVEIVQMVLDNISIYP